MYNYVALLFSLVIIPNISGDVLPMDQVIAQAASQVQDTGLLWDDSSILLELDMRFTHEQWRRIQELRGDYGRYRRKRKAYKPAVTRWDNGKVPYSISEGFSREGENVIKEAMKEWSRVTCVQFKRASGSEPSITFVPTGGCSSNVGKTGRVGQPLTLGSGCLVKGIVIHEIGHALGFFHEQSRPDRDYYVSINKANILPNMGYNFEKYDESTIDTHRIPYDYQSVMHYGPYYFSRNGRKTMNALDPSKTKLMGNRYGLTFNDIWLANLMYSCAKRNRCDVNKRCGSEGFLGKDCRCWCKGNKKEEPVQYCDTGKPISVTIGVRPTSKPVVKTEEPDGLIDLHVGEGCSDWAAGGFCEYDSYTMEQCRRTCYEYKLKKTTTPPSGDRHPHCRYWAEMGECENNPSYMQVYCKSSCGLLVTKCRDAIPRMCDLFKKECFSKNLQSIMRKFCPKTCHSCTRDQRIASCEDVAPKACGLYALVGKCVDADTNIKKKMQIMCPKACGLCERAADEGSSSRGGRTSRLVDRNCVDRVGFCLTWSKKGRCDSFFSKTFMKIFCRRSCNLC